MQLTLHIAQMMAPETDIAGETPDQQLARQHAMLRRLAEIGMTIAETLELRTLAAEADKAPADVITDIGLTFSRVARSVCEIVTLEGRAEDHALARERTRKAHASEDAAEVRRDCIHAAKRQVIETFRDAVDMGLDREVLDLTEQLLKTDCFDDDLFALPLNEAFAIIGAALGGEFDRKTFGVPESEGGEAEAAAEAADPIRGANGADLPPPRLSDLHPEASSKAAPPAEASAKAGHDPP